MILLVYSALVKLHQTHCVHFSTSHFVKEVDPLETPEVQNKEY